MNTIVLIPAYCPCEELPAFVLSLHEEGCKVVIVNDGSPAAYRMIFAKCSEYATVIDHIENQGKGKALKTGLKYISEHYSDSSIIVTADADGQHAINDILSCAKKASENPRSLVLGSRDFHTKDIPFKSKAGNLITEKVFAVSTGIHIADTQTGLRAFQARLVPLMLKVDGDRYEYELNQLLLCVSKEINLIEVPIQVIYIDQNASSHFHPIRDSFLIYRRLLRFTLSSLSSFLVDYGLFNLFAILSGRIILSNICARILSAGFNYEVNRNLVFHHSASRKKSFWKYACTAISILIANTVILYFLADVLHIVPFIAKLITEVSLFVVPGQSRRHLSLQKRKEQCYEEKILTYLRYYCNPCIHCICLIGYLCHYKDICSTE